MKYVIHHAETGVIRRHGMCPEADIPLQDVPDGHALLSLPDAHPPIDDRIHQVTAGAIAARVPAAADPVASMRALRSVRNRLLAACDWTQLVDVPLSAAVRAAWNSYRQALRDLPASTLDPANPAWPQSPLKD